MSSKITEGGMQKQGGTFADRHATATSMMVGNLFKAAEVHKLLAESSADLGRSMIDAATRTGREITRMSLEAMAHGDPLALMTLAPRAAQTGCREGIECATRAVQAAQSLAKTILGTGPETSKGGTDQP